MPPHENNMKTITTILIFFLSISALAGSEVQPPTSEKRWIFFKGKAEILEKIKKGVATEGETAFTYVAVGPTVNDACLMAFSPDRTVFTMGADKFDLPDSIKNKTIPNMNYYMQVRIDKDEVSFDLILTSTGAAITYRLHETILPSPQQLPRARLIKKEAGQVCLMFDVELSSLPKNISELYAIIRKNDDILITQLTDEQNPIP